MYFKGKEKRLLLSVSEAVRIAGVRYGMSGDGEDAGFVLSPCATFDGGVPAAPSGAALFFGEFPFDAFSLSLYGCAEAERDESGALRTLSLCVTVPTNPERLEKNVLARIRAEGFLLAFLAHSEGDIAIRFELYSAVYDKRVTLTEQPHNMARRWVVHHGRRHKQENTQPCQCARQCDRSFSKTPDQANPKYILRSIYRRNRRLPNIQLNYLLHFPSRKRIR